MRKFNIIAVLILLLLLIQNLTLTYGQESNPDRYEKYIQETFEQADKTNFPQKGVIVFTGSSSIKLWNTLTEDFIPFNVINRGFGGSQLSDVIYFADRIIIKYNPSMVVLYCGENDIAVGKTPERVFIDFKKLINHIHKSLPNTIILYIPCKPSIRRWEMRNNMNKINRLIEDYIKKDKLVEFVDVRPAMLGKDGKPNPDIFVEDNLHMNAKGYSLWTPHVRDYILKHISVHGTVQ
ncbi:SGNH/GDSL hydrolase family protein [candidate division KSB1 bacterium]